MQPKTSDTICIHLAHDIFLKIAIFENHEIPLCFWDIPALTKIELFSTKCILPLIENYFGEWAQ